jgi:hypothetical protein
MFIEKFGDDLKISKQALAQAKTDEAKLISLDNNIQQNETTIDKLAFLDSSLANSQQSYNQYMTNYNNFLDKITTFYNITRRQATEVTLPYSVIFELVPARVTFQKSFETSLVIEAGFSYRNSTVNDFRNVYDVFYDIGNGWQFISRFFYAKAGSVQFDQVYHKIQNIPPGTITLKIGIEDRTDRDARILGYNIVVREVM